MANAMRRSTHGNHPLASAGQWDAYQYGNRGTAAPEALRPLSDAERAVNTTWRWSPDLGTYVSDEHPSGIA